MGIAPYLKEIARGKEGARSLNRDQACDLLGQILDGQAYDLEVGAFCASMRIKGETPEEMAGFLDAVHKRVHRFRVEGDCPVVVLPTYNGARRMPVLTPLLAALLAKAGVQVLMHGHETEDARVSSLEVLMAMQRAGWQEGALVTEPDHRHFAGLSVIKTWAAPVCFYATDVLLPPLARLLDVRRVVGLRNSAHSLVKMMNPMVGPSVLVSSYTHPEYLHSMTETLALTGAVGLLLRGTEGEAVADTRRVPVMDYIAQGSVVRLEEGQAGSLASVPQLPDKNPEETARWTLAVLNGEVPIPEPIRRQVAYVIDGVQALQRRDE